jgi:DNA-directed RNA polymerase specialized sigma24 family protein
MPSRDADDERQLAEDALAGYHASFAELHSRYYSRVYRYILTLTGGADASASLAGEVFSRLAHTLDQFQWRDSTLAVSLFRIAHGILAGKTPEEVRILSLRSHQTSALFPADAHLVSNWLVVSGMTFGTRKRWDEERQVMALRFAAELTAAETARVLGKNERYTRKLEHRVIARLRDMLGFSAAVPEDDPAMLKPSRRRVASDRLAIAFAAVGVAMLAVGLFAFVATGSITGIFGGGGHSQLTTVAGEAATPLPSRTPVERGVGGSSTPSPSAQPTLATLPGSAPTIAPTTPAETAPGPTTPVPTEPEPTIPLPTTPAPTTPAPTTPATTTPAPTTTAPTAQAPTTPAPTPQVTDTPG